MFFKLKSKDLKKDAHRLFGLQRIIASTKNSERLKEKMRDMMSFSLS